MDRYALATFSAGGRAKAAGLVIDQKIAALDDLIGGEVHGPLRPGVTVFDLLQAWDEALLPLDALCVKARQPGSATWLDVEEVNFHSPVEPVRQIFCTGANYRTHVVDITVDTGAGPDGLSRDELRLWAESMMDNRLANGDPYVFTKPVSALAGPNEPLVLPKNTNKPDWEIELAVVIGREGLNISLDEAMSYVAGYAVANDISARDHIARTDYKMLGTDWLRAKGQPGFLPLGPYLVPAKFVPDPYNLKMQLSVDGRLMQDETTADMMFDIARQIEYISRYARLLPGDVICTGSPAGNGTHYNRYLKEGDLMVGEIEGLGVQRIRCIAANG